MWATFSSSGSTQESYQPRTQETPPSPGEALKTALGAYSVARQHDLVGLEALAREQISKLGADIPVSTIVKAVQDAYPGTIPKEDDWLKGCVKSLLKVAIKNGSASATHEEMDEGVADAPMSNIIIHALVDACREVVAEIVAEAAPMDTAMPPTTPPVDEPEASAEPASPESTALRTPQTGEATINPNEMIHDPLMTTSPADQKEEEEGKEDAIDRQDHPDPPKECEHALDPIPEAEPAKEEEVDFWARPVKGKKSKKPKKWIANKKPEPEPMAEPEPAAEIPVDGVLEACCEPEKTVDDNFWGATVSKKGKKGKRNKEKKAEMVAEEREPDPQAVEECVLEPESFPTSEVPEAPVPEVVDEWATPAVGKKKKKKAVSIGSLTDVAEEQREIAEAGKEAAVTVVTEVEVERDPWSFWGATRSPTSRQSLS